MSRLIFAFVLLLGGTLSCFAQTGVLPSYRNASGGTTEVSAANPFPVTGGGGGGGTSSSFSAAFPAIGTAMGLSDGTNMQSWLTGLSLGDAVNGNNSGTVVAYGFNGATYDRLRTDTTNGLWVNVKAIAGQNNNIGTNADAVAGAATSVAPVGSFPFAWNGTNFDRVRAFSGLTGVAPPAGVAYIGANASGATGGQLRGMITCDNHVFKHITSATDTFAIQGVASQTIYICGWRARAAGTATWFLENTASANANCSSTLTQIAGVATETTNSGEVLYSPFWGGLKNTAGNGLCINSTGTGGVDVDLWYTQF